MNQAKTNDDDIEAMNEKKHMVVGLGNPGRKYRQNRHNLGFMVLDKLAARYQIKMSRVQSQAVVGTGKTNTKGVILVKPMAFMNLSGRPVGALSRYYKIAMANLLVIYDEIDIPFGSIRIRTAGGSGGHNGMSSIIKQIGNDFPRLRIGVGRPAGRMEPAAFVLKNFSKEESEFVGAILEQAADAVDLFLLEGPDAAMNKYNRAHEQSK